MKRIVTLALTMLLLLTCMTAQAEVSRDPHLDVAFTCLEEGGEAVTLIKPQFEAHESQLRKGVVRDAKVHEAVLENMLAWFAEHGFTLLHLDFSPITGPKGNIEFLAHIRKGEAAPAPDVAALVAQAHEATAGTARNTL